MFAKKKKSAQSILEYAVLLGVVITAITVMQVVVRRGFQGSLRDSADKMGDAYSVSGTTTMQERRLDQDRRMTHESATAAGSPIAGLVGDADFKFALDSGAYSVSEQTGREISERRERTDAVTQETFAWDEYDDTTHADFDVNNPLNLQ